MAAVGALAVLALAGCTTVVGKSVKVEDGRRDFCVTVEEDSPSKPQWDECGITEDRWKKVKIGDRW